MSEAYDTLMSLTDDEIEAYTASPETEGHIVIDEDRFVTVPNTLHRIAVQYDHNVETVTFDCPRYWDGHDLATMQIYINYILSNGETGSYKADNVIAPYNTFYAPTPAVSLGSELKEYDLEGSLGSITINEETKVIRKGVTTSGDTVYYYYANRAYYLAERLSEEDKIIHFDWTISNNVTQYNGQIRFLVCAKTTDTDGNEVLHWNSELNSDMYISEGLEGVEHVIQEYTDLITQLLTRMDTVEQINIQADTMQTLYKDTNDLYLSTVGFERAASTAAASAEAAKTEAESINEETRSLMSDTLNDVNATVDEAIAEVRYDYANAVKAEATGELICIDDASPLNHPVEASVRFKNLLKRTNSNTYVAGINNSGITFSVNDDGTVSAIGTASGTSYYLMQGSTDYNYQIPLPRGRYTVSKAPAQGCRITVGLRSGAYGERVLYYSTFTNTVTFDVTDDITVYDMILCVDSGYTVDTVFEPQIEAGDISTEYTPYLCPETVLNITRCGKNLVDMSGYEFNDSNYTHMLQSTNASANDFYNFMRAHPGKSIIYSMTVTGTASGIDIGSIRFYDANSDLICALVPNVAHTIKTDLPETFALSYIYGSGTGASVKNIQVEFGTVVTEYEQYLGDVYTLSAYQIPTSNTIIFNNKIDDMTSLAPTMIVMSNMPGVLVDVKYNKDTMKSLEPMVKYSAQLLDLEQQKQARMNIGAIGRTEAINRIENKTDAIIRSVEGESIILQDASDDPLRGLRVMGRTKQLTTTGSNLLNSTAIGGTVYGVTFTVNADKSVTAKGTATQASYLVLEGGYASTKIPIPSKFNPGETYTIQDAGIFLYSESGEQTSFTDMAFVFPEGYDYYGIFVRVSANVSVDKTYYPRINAGSTVLPYEPYTGAKSSPRPDHPQNLISVDKPTITVNGKNLFDMSKIINTDLISKLDDGTISVSHYYCPTTVKLNVLAPGMVAGKAYTLDLDTDGSKFVYLNSYGRIWNSGASLVVTDAMLNSLVTLYGKSEQVDGSTIIRSIQFRLTGTSSGIEEYKETQLMSISNTLRGIPVNNNGNYTDSNGQQWISDEIDLERGVYIKRIGEIVVDNSMTYFYNTDNNFLHTGSNLFDNVAAWETRIMSTHFVAVGNGIDMYDYGWFQFNGNGGIRFRIEGVDTVESLIEWLNNNDVKVVYPYSTPIEIELTTEVIEAYKELHTNSPNTTVLNTCNAGMIVEYNLDTERYVQSKIDDAIEQFKKYLVDNGYGRYIGKTVNTAIVSGSTTANILLENGNMIYATAGTILKTYNNSFLMFDGSTWNPL